MAAQVLGIQPGGLFLGDIHGDDVVGDGIGVVHFTLVDDVLQRSVLNRVHKPILGHVAPGEVLVDVGGLVVDHLTVEPVAGDSLILILRVVGQLGIIVLVVGLLHKTAILQIHFNHVETVQPVGQRGQHHIVPAAHGKHRETVALATAVTLGHIVLYIDDTTPEHAVLLVEHHVDGILVSRDVQVVQLAVGSTPRVDVGLGGEHHLVNLAATANLLKSGPETLVLHQLSVAETQHIQAVGRVLLGSGEHQLATRVREDVTRGGAQVHVGVRLDDVVLRQEALGHIDVVALAAVGADEQELGFLELQFNLLVHRPDNPVSCIIMRDTLAAPLL